MGVLGGVGATPKVHFCHVFRRADQAVGAVHLAESEVASLELNTEERVDGPAVILLAFEVGDLMCFVDVKSIVVLELV